MLFRYDFGDKPDLSNFKKQATHYIGNMRELTYNIFLCNYKLVVEIAKPDYSNAHTTTISFFEIQKDSDGNIVSEKVIVPLIDIRFNDIKSIQNLFKIDNYKAYFDSNSCAETVDKICSLIKILSKINNLIYFI